MSKPIKLICGQTNFDEKIVKKMWVKKSFWSKTALGLKIFWVKKVFGQKKFSQKYFWVKIFFWSNLVLKKFG